MKNNKPDAELLWKQLDDILVPRLGLTLAERVVYHHLVRHSRLEGKRQLRFSIVWLARSVRLSDRPARHAVRSLAAKGALRVVDRSQAGHLVEVLLPDEVHATPHEGAVSSCVAQRPSSRNLEEMDFLQVSSRREAIHARERGLCFYCLRRFVARGRVLDHVVPRARGGSNSYRNLVSCCVECKHPEGRNGRRRFSAHPLSPAPLNLCRTRRPPARPGSARRRRAPPRSSPACRRLQEPKIAFLVVGVGLLTP